MELGCVVMICGAFVIIVTLLVDPKGRSRPMTEQEKKDARPWYERHRDRDL